MKRGEIYFVDLGPAIGSEPGGTRPAVVVSGDVFNLVPYLVIVVIGDDDPSLPERAGVLVRAEVYGLTANVVFFPPQVRALDPSRFPDRPAGTVPSGVMEKISSDLRLRLDL